MRNSRGLRVSFDRANRARVKSICDKFHGFSPLLSRIHPAVATTSIEKQPLFFSLIQKPTTFAEVKQKVTKNKI